MNNSKAFGRLAILVAGLGLGVAVTAAGTAWADAAESIIPDAAASLDASSLGALLPAADIPFGQDLAISFDGMTLFDNGTATATTASGSFGLAIAFGDGSTASNLPINGGADSLFNTAIADGAGSNALSTGGNFGTAIANGADSSAYSNGIGNFVSATGYESNASAALGDYNTVLVNGAGSSGTVLGLGGGGDGNLLSVFGVNDLADTSGTNSIISIIGNNDVQASTDGLRNIAAIFGDGSMAQAAGGNDTIAAVFGDGSTAFAGLGNNGLAAVFGDLLSASAIQGGTDIEPSLTAASSAADLFGGADVSWLTDFLDGSWLTAF